MCYTEHTIIREIESLVAELESAALIYYQTAKESPLSDEEYDAKLQYLADLLADTREIDADLNARANALINHVSGGTRVVSLHSMPGDKSSQDASITHHKIPMLSLAKANTEGEIVSYLTETSKYGASDKGWALQAKLDGVAIVARYSGGEIRHIVTRGNGEVGEDLSDVLRLVKAGKWRLDGLPLKIPDSQDIEVRGEMLMTYEQFKNLNYYYRELNFEQNADTVVRYKHPRNAVSGIINQETSNYITTSDLNFVAIDFETANSNTRSATSIGAVKVVGGKVVDEFFSYITLPEDCNEYTIPTWRKLDNIRMSYKNSLKLGRPWKDVARELEEFAEGYDFVAHNAQFDRDVMFSLNVANKINFFPRFWDTVANARRITKQCGIDTKCNLKEVSLRLDLTTPEEYKSLGHSSLFDAKLCALLMIKLFNMGELKSYAFYSESAKFMKADEKTAAEQIAEIMGIPASSARMLYDVQTRLCIDLIREPVALSFYAYTAIVAGEISDSYDYVTNGFISAASMTDSVLGVVDSYKTPDSVLRGVELFGQARIDSKVPFPTDGIVIKCVENAKVSAAMGSTAHHPRSQIAFKYPPSGANTEVLDIQIDVGRTGRISFRAKIKPVVIDGITIEYATLHNYSWMSDRDVRIGSKVKIVRANDVIPYVDAVLSNPEGTVKYPEPTQCPLCYTELDKSTLLVRCPNDDCESRGLSALFTAVSKKYLNIEDMSEKLLEDLIGSGKVHNLADIFDLTESELATLKIRERSLDTGIAKAELAKGEFEKDIFLGEKMANKIYGSIQRAKNTRLPRILAALNIRMLGLQAAKELVSHFGDIDSILNASVEDLKAVRLISDTKADVIFDGLQSRKHMLARMREQGFVALQAAGDSVGGNIPAFLGGHTENAQSDRLAGHIIVISGSVPGMNRDEAHDYFESLGAATSGSVSSKTTLVLADPQSTSSKVQKAHQLGIRVVQAADFLAELAE